ncbi:MAG: hypothetical protein CVV63_04290, partial [Tenericutes bacterium HGW-Tenericutes-8]
MKKLTQKLVLSVITMALVVVALGTSTFAWFTLANTSTVTAFNAQVTSGEGIEVSLGTWNTNTAIIDGSSTWGTILQGSSINSRISTMLGATPLVLTDLTSANGQNITDYAGTTVAYTTGKYVQFDLFFRSGEAVTIEWDSVTLGGSTKTWTVDVPTFRASNTDVYSTGADFGTLTGNTVMEVAGYNAARVSVFGSTGATYQKDAVNGSTDLTT